MQIQMEYLYRDAGNYKVWGSTVFANPQGLSLDTIQAQTKDHWIDGCYFIAANLQLPSLHTSPYDAELDHSWHEFHAFTETVELPNDAHHRRIDDFVARLQQQRYL